MLKDSFWSVETISEQGKLNQCLIYWKTRVYLIHHHWREGVSVFNPFSHESCAKEYTTPALGIYNTLRIITLMCVTVKNANLSGQCSDRTRPNYTDFFHHSLDCQNLVKTDAMSNIMMQYIITKFNWKIVCLCDATYSEKWCREHQCTFLSKYVYKIAKCIICLMTMVNRSCYNFKTNWAIEKSISDSDSAQVFQLGTLKTSKLPFFTRGGSDSP